jgi:pilus assembly protein Flp/PilA
MKTSTENDRRTERAAVDPLADDRREATEPRRKSPRTRTLKGAQIVWADGPALRCIVRNLSQTGACLEVYGLIPYTFDLVIDCDKSRHSCSVVWRRAPRIGVKFLKNLLAHFAADETAATAIEYGLISGLIALVIIGAVTKLGKDVSAKFNAIAANLS